MTAALAFLLELAALAALTGTLVSLAAGLAWWSLGARVRSPFVRADLAFLLGTLPATATLAVLLAAIAPPLRALFGGPDHCVDHAHHLHLCLIHFAGLRPGLAVAGAAALAAFAWRLGTFLAGERAATRRLRLLEGLGEARTDAHGSTLLLLPGAPGLCHAAGILRRRIFLSASLAGRLDPGALEGALAHERAHLRRRDPLSRLLLAGAGLFALPFVARTLARAHRDAAEEACDLHAAAEVGDGALVASALVQVAKLQRDVQHLALAFGGSALERRVRALLDVPPRTRTPLSLALGCSVLLAGAAVALAFDDAIHHAVETLFAHLS
ncbi:M56 family metallopeptidase [Vulgatibacter sp.]|uniref:M56 family metallopeptidase n=1 Tax=Vulgatibacter sp. TaxID=1971226 RepID=UPI003565B140